MKGTKSVNSNFIGFQLGLNYGIFSLQGSYNNIWGGSNSFNGGSIVSPDTYGLDTDPLYTLGWVTGMVELSSGSAYKIAPSLNLLSGNLQISPSYEYFATNTVPSISEYDIVIVYNIPEVKGLTVLAGYGYLVPQNTTDSQTNGVTYQGQLMISYLY